MAVLYLIDVVLSFRNLKLVLSNVLIDYTNHVAGYEVLPSILDYSKENLTSL